MHFAMFLLQNQPDPEQVKRIVLALMALLPILILIALVVVIVPTWFICKRAGFSPWLSMLCLVPSVGLLILLYVLAFADWKVMPVPQTGWTPGPPRA